MKKIFNTLNTLIKAITTKEKYESILEINYWILVKLGFLRGLWSRVRGKVKIVGSDFHPLILGASTQLLIRPGSRIILRNEKKSNSLDVYINNPVYPTAATIGVKPHYSAIDPPTFKLTRIELLGGSKLFLETNTMILSGSYFTASNNAVISIGKNCYISQEVKINSRCGISIGNNVLVGYQTMIMDYDGHTIIYSSGKTNENKPIVINDNVWIGCRVTILKGITIGSGSIIAANSCVVSNVPPNTMVAGNPAKVIKENISWKR